MTIIDAKDRFVWHGEPLPKAPEQEIFELSPFEQVAGWLMVGERFADSEQEEGTTHPFEIVLPKEQAAIFTYSMQDMLSGRSAEYQQIHFLAQQVLRVIGVATDPEGRHAVVDMEYMNASPRAWRLPVKTIHRVRAHWVSEQQLDKLGI